MDLPDLNVWLAFSLADHPHHARARRYWDQEARDPVAFCRLTALGLLRLLSNATVMQGQPFSPPQAWEAYQAFRELPEVVLTPEPEGAEGLLAEWARKAAFPARAWTDAYLAAFALAAGLRLVSFDADFRRFENLDLLHLSA